MMKILSVRRGFLADHSSTSYEFLAIDKPLDSKARAAVSRLSSRARPSARRVSFIYHAEGYDIPGGWEPLLLKHYDVMYSESYDWWTFAVAFNTKNKSLVSKLKKYAFYGADDLGVSVQHKRDRVIVTISCMLDAGAVSTGAWEEQYHGDDDDEEEDVFEESGVATDDSLLDFLAELRSCLKRGECEPLYAVWKEYGLDDDEEEDSPPKPKPKKSAKGAAVAAELARMLTSP
jgi:hypothetical protein